VQDPRAGPPTVSSRIVGSWERVWILALFVSVASSYLLHQRCSSNSFSLLPLVVKEGVYVSKQAKGRGGWVVCKRALWVRRRVSDRKSGGKSERDAQRLPKKTVFLVWMPVESRNQEITI